MRTPLVCFWLGNVAASLVPDNPVAWLNAAVSLGITLGVCGVAYVEERRRQVEKAARYLNAELVSWSLSGVVRVKGRLVAADVARVRDHLGLKVVEA